MALGDVTHALAMAGPDFPLCDPFWRLPPISERTCHNR